MKLKESNIVESMENKELGTLRLDVDLYPKLKQKQPRLDNVIEEKYIDCKWTENVSEIKKNEYNTGQIAPMDKKCKEILGNIVRPEYSDIEKTMAIYAYIVENIKYDDILLKKEKELKDKGQKIGKGVSKILNGKQSSYNAFMKGEVVCEGYTNMMHYMLSSVGIESKTVICIGERDNGETSFVDRGENHSVIRVKTGDDWYYYDPTLDAGKMELRNAFKTKKEFEKNHTFTVLEEKIENPKEKAYTVDKLNERLRYVLEDRKNIVLEKKENEQKENNFNRLYQRYGVTGNDLGREVDELNNIDEKEFKERNNEKERLDRESGEKDARSFDERAYSELYSILQMLGKEYIDRIPRKIYKVIESRKDDTYNPVYNDMEEVLEGRVKRKTVSMLALLDYNYFSTSETDRMYMRYILEENENKYRKEKKEYKIVNIDEDQKKVDDNIKEIEQINNDNYNNINKNEMIEYKESGIKKLFNNIIVKIKEIFRIK